MRSVTDFFVTNGVTSILTDRHAHSFIDKDTTKHNLLLLQNSVTTEWVAGGVAEVGWGIIANHGGGYSYRLCRREEGGALTEECFQRMPLR